MRIPRGRYYRCSLVSKRTRRRQYDANESIDCIPEIAGAARMHVDQRGARAGTLLSRAVNGGVWTMKTRNRILTLALLLSSGITLAEDRVFKARTPLGIVDSG